MKKAALLAMVICLFLAQLALGADARRWYTSHLTDPVGEEFIYLGNFGNVLILSPSTDAPLIPVYIYSEYIHSDGFRYFFWATEDYSYMANVDNMNRLHWSAMPRQR